MVNEYTENKFEKKAKHIGVILIMTTPIVFLKHSEIMASLNI